MTFNKGSAEALAVRTKAVLAPRATTGNPIHANPPGLSGSLPDTTPISRSPVRVALSPG